MALILAPLDIDGRSAVCSPVCLFPFCSHCNTSTGIYFSFLYFNLMEDDCLKDVVFFKDVVLFFIISVFVIRETTTTTTT